MRKPMIAGNWKMNKTPAETVALVEDLKKIQVRTKAEVVVCPMTVSLFAAATQLKGTDIKLGAQNVHFEDKGAFTGECNIASLKELGVEYVILGHSERRQYFAETWFEGTPLRCGSQLFSAPVFMSSSQYSGQRPNVKPRRAYWRPLAHIF